MTQSNSIEQRALSAAERGLTFTIKNNEQYLQAAELLKDVQLLQKEVNSTFNPIIDKAHLTHKEAIAQKGKFAIPLKNAEFSYKNMIAKFDDDQEAIRKKEEDRLRKEAEKKEQDLKDKAAEALKKGDEKKAEKLIDKAAEIVKPTVAPKHEQPDNISFIIYYEAQIINRFEIPRKMQGIELMIPDVKAINKLANASKGTIKIPGVQILTKKRVSGRSA